MTFKPKRARSRLRLIAVALLTGALIASPIHGQAGAVDELIKEAHALLAKGDGPGAEAHLRKALEGRAARPAIAAGMGRALLAQGKVQEARGWLVTKEFSNATALDGFRALASLELRDNRLTEAGVAYNQALALAPDNSALWVDIARFRYLGGEHKLAIEAADHALNLNPQDAGALLLQAELVRDRQGMVPALPWYEKAVQQSPNDISILLSYAATLGEAGRTVKMLAITRKVLEMDPRNPRAFYLQAVMAARAGDYWLARKLLEKTAGQMQNVPGYRLLKGVVEVSAGNYSLAIKVLEPLVRQQPSNSKARDLMARAMFLNGEFRSVAQRFGEIANYQEASAYLRMTVARAMEHDNQRDQAAPLLNRVARAAVRPVWPVITNQPVGQLLANGDTGQAGMLTGQWLARNPGNFDNLALSGDVAFAAGNVAQALSYYEQAAFIRMPESLMTRRFQAMLIAGQLEQANAMVRTYLLANPQSVEARRLMAWLSAQAGNWQTARSLLQSLVDDGRTSDVQLLSDLAVAQIGAGALDDAEMTAKKAYTLFPAHPVAAQAWGFALAAKGKEQDKDEAEALLVKARGIMGDSLLLVQARAMMANNSPG